MIRYADIALPVGVDKTFTYLIPPDLATSVMEGVRVVVPFGTKYATGIVVAVSEQSEIQGIKPIRDVIDPGPVVADDVLRLCRWIADYYMAPLGEVLKAALPQGFSPSSRRIVRTTPAASTLSATLTAQRKKILDLLLEKGPMRTQDLARKTGLRTVNSIVNDLAREGLLEAEEVVQRPRQPVRAREHVRLDQAETTAIEEAITGLGPRRKKARQLLETILALKASGSTSISSTEILKKAGVTSAMLKEFVGSGLLPTFRVEGGGTADYGTDDQTLSLVLNAAQQAVLSEITGAIARDEAQTFLLHGVTGSGKTQVYIEAIRHCLNAGKGAIILVPEISLTPQIVRRFNTHFAGTVAVVHSRMSAAERYDVWRKARSGEYRVVIGPRSALFAPVRKPGLIVIDEEHEASYKQYDAVPRYHARDAAIMRAKLMNAVTVLGSATPSLESYYNARAGKYRLLGLPERVDNVPMPHVEIVDMREERRRELAALKQAQGTARPREWRKSQQGALSETMKEKILDRMSRKEGIILLQNRRGFAPFVECLDCGYCEECERCSVTLTYHLAQKQLRCHYCGTVYRPHTTCPRCGSASLALRGIGTQRVEEELAKEIPAARVLRMDLDTTTGRGSHERILRKFGEGGADILLGTQMVAKGLDFPRVTLVGVISADTQMLLPDFRSAERTFQLLTQVAGRSGRSTLRGEVLIQSHQPDHFALTHVLDHDYRAFYEQEIASRQELDYPPFSRLVLIEFKGKDESEVRAEAERVRDLLRVQNGVLSLLGPAPAVIAKINEQYRWHIIIKSLRSQDPSGSALRRHVRNSLAQSARGRRRSVRIIVDVDPVGML